MAPLKLENLKLVPYQSSFLDQMFEWRNQSSTLNFNPVEPISKEEFGERCAAVRSDLSRYGSDSRYRWCIMLGDELVGHVGCTPNYKMKLAEIGYAVNEKLAGRGIATKAVRALAEKLFRETDLRKLTAGIHADNIGSLRVLEKLGFKREGVLRQQFFLRGIAADEIVFGLLKFEITD